VVRETLAWLEKTGTKATCDGMARYGLPSARAFGVPVGTLRTRAKALGPSHALALALWETDRYEARMLAAFVDEPDEVAVAQMDAWCRDFDNWGICDTVCFHLFDRTPHAFGRVAKWATLRGEFQKRAAFALLASVALHDKAAPDEPFLKCLPLVERAASDGRNFVKKGVSWALRLIGRRNAAMHAASVALARRLAAASGATERWVGGDALRDLTRPDVVRRLKAKRG
jgi:3-methyladenine DNA glycosylase AlkD